MFNSLASTCDFWPRHPLQQRPWRRRCWTGNRSLANCCCCCSRFSWCEHGCWQRAQLITPRLPLFCFVCLCVCVYVRARTHNHKDTYTHTHGGGSDASLSSYTPFPREAAGASLNQTLLLLLLQRQEGPENTRRAWLALSRRRPSQTAANWGERNRAGRSCSRASSANYRPRQSAGEAAVTQAC